MFLSDMRISKIWASLHPFYEQGAILGRIEANRCFIRALLTADPFDAYHFFLPHADDCAALRAALQAHFPSLLEAGRFVLRTHRELPAALALENYYCMHLSDPFVRYTDAMCLRNAFSRRIFPLTAPTHSLSYAEYGTQFFQHIWGGATKRDAVVATSRAGLDVVRNYYALLMRNYGLDPENFFSPELRHIPLGVEPADLPAPEEKDALSAVFRLRHNLGDALVILVFARISYHSKMDLLPVLRALKRAETYGMKAGSYHLVLAGWQDDEDSFGVDLRAFATNLGISCLIVAKPDHETRKALYAAADIFLSPADNLQETFGLTLLEAAASSLPVIASDFDGYKDLVLEGETGFLTPTIGPSSTPETDALRNIVPGGEYHLLLSQQCVVEVEALGRTVSRLALDAELRRKMGEAGRKRVLSSFTWQLIVRRYLELWKELNAAPCALSDAPKDRPLAALYHPAGSRYMEIFSAYCSRRSESLTRSGRRLRWSRAGEAVYRGKDFPVIYRLIENRVDMNRLKQLLFFARHPVVWEELLKMPETGCPADGLQDPEFLPLWALKQDLLEFVPEERQALLKK